MCRVLTTVPKVDFFVRFVLLFTYSLMKVLDAILNFAIFTLFRQLSCVTACV